MATKITYHKKPTSAPVSVEVNVWGYPGFPSDKKPHVFAELHLSCNGEFIAVEGLNALDKLIEVLNKAREDMAGQIVAAEKKYTVTVEESED